jgi:integrase
VLTKERGGQLTPDVLSLALIVAAPPQLAEHKVEKFTPHDLRRTARTLLSKLKVQRDIAELVLGHAEKNKMVRHL